MEEITKAYAWQESLELSKRLVEICEQFSDTETNVLVGHLRQAIVDIPACIAADLEANRPANKEAVVKLLAELELVKKIYPAIETAPADEQLEKLLQRMTGENFGEREPADEDGEEDTDLSELPTPDTTGEASVEAATQPAGGTVISPRVDGVQSGVTSIDVSSEEG